MSDADRKKSERAGAFLIIAWMVCIGVLCGAQLWWLALTAFVAGAMMAMAAAALIYPDTQGPSQ